MSSNLVKNIGISDADMIHKLIGNTCIVEYGIIKAIPSTGIVTVEMSVAEKAEDIVITNCVLANFAGSSVTVNVTPKIDDKVLVLFPRKYAGDMFKTENNEPIISEGTSGYKVMGGIALLVNQYQTESHKNSIDFTDGTLTIKLAYSEDDSENLFTLTVGSDGAFMLTNKAVTVNLGSDGSITVSNENATISVDADGNVVIDTAGTYTIKNADTDLMQVVDGLAQELENLTTTGSPATQATSPASKTSIGKWRTNQLQKLFGA